MKENNRKLNILHIVSTKKWTGVADPSLSLASYQQQLGHNVFFAATPGASFEKNIRETKVIFLDGFNLGHTFHPIKFYKDIKKLAAFIDEKKIDVVHVHLHHEQWIGAFAKKKTKKKFILVRSYHRHKKPSFPFLCQGCYRDKIDFIITTSASTKELFLKYINKPQEDVKVVYGAVDHEFFHPEYTGENIKNELNIDHESPVVGIVSHIREGKGFEWLFDTAPIVREKIPDVKFLIFGKGKYKKTLRHRVKDEKLENTIIFAGYRLSDLPEAYASIDASLYLALSSEGSCRASLEAMACGKPIIATDSGPLPEIVENDHNGIIVKHENRQSLADAIVKILSNPELRDKYSKNSRAIIENKFLPEIRAKSVIDLYYEYLHKKDIM